MSCMSPLQALWMNKWLLHYRKRNNERRLILFRDVVSSVDACSIAACIHAWCELAYGVHRVLQHDVMAPDKGVLKSPNTL